MIDGRIKAFLFIKGKVLNQTVDLEEEIGRSYKMEREGLMVLEQAGMQASHKNLTLERSKGICITWK